MVIDKLKKKLHDSIKKYGLNSKETYDISVKLDEAINEYYNENRLTNNDNKMNKNI